MRQAPQPTGLRLAAGQVTVLLGSATARRTVTALLDDASARCGHGHDVRVVVRVRPAGSYAERLVALERAAEQRVPVVVAERVTDGLSAADRRAVLTRLRSLAAGGAAVLVDDADPVAALAVADAALRCGDDGSLCDSPLGLPQL